MKRFFGIIFVLVIIISVGLFAFMLTFDANKYSPLLIEKIEEVTNKKVEISNISLNFFPRLAFRIDGFSIKDRDTARKASRLDIASIEASIKLLPLIKKAIEVEDLRIKGLDLKVTKDVLAASRSRRSANTTKSNVDIGFATVGALKFLAKSIFISDSTISYDEIELDIVEAVLKNISIYGPIKINARLSIFGRGKENIKLDAVLYPGFGEKETFLKNLEIVMNLSRFNFQSALNTFPELDVLQQFIEKEFEGELVVNSDKIYLDKRKIFDSNLYIKLSNGMINFTPIKDRLKNIELQVELNKRDVTIENFTASIAEGKWSAKGSIKDIFTRQNSNLNIMLENINVGLLMPDIAPGQPDFEGIVNIDITAQAKGLSGKELKETLVSQGNFKLDKAVLNNMNILTTTLSKLDMFPGLIQKLARNLPERYRELLKQNYTIFKPLDTQFRIKNGKLLFEKVIVASDGFYLVSSGYLDIDRNIDMYCNLFIEQDLSNALINVIDELEFLENSQGMITLPLDIVGNFPNISVRPDLDYVIQKLAVSKGRELLKGLFRTRLPEEPPEAAIRPEENSSPEREPQTQQTKEIEPAEALIRSIFDILTNPE